MNRQYQTRRWTRSIVLAGSVFFLLAGCTSSQNSTTPTAPQQNSSPTPAAAGALPTKAALSDQAPAVNPSPSPAQENTAAPSPTAEPPVQTLASIPNPDDYAWKPVAAGLQNPVGLAVAGDGSGRLFVLEQAGRIRIIQNGSLLPTPFLDIVDRVGSGGERGLLGLVFHPDYPDSPYFYVNYTDKNGDTHISRFQVTQDPNAADPASEDQLIFQDQPFANHNGGSMVFGPDGTLYLGLGDGGSGGDPNGNGQSLNTLLGKVLRIDVSSGDPYSIPPDNPFANGGGKPEIWAYGLRNPWRFSFDRQTGEMFIADVGQGTWEEVDYLPAKAPGGTNFGWNYREGAHPYSKTAPPAGLNLVDPIWEYSHAEGGCSITGGYVYRGKLAAAWNGVYLTGDYCSGKVWGIVQNGGKWTGTLIYQTSFAITSFGQDENGEVYLVDGNGGVYRLEQK